MRCSSFTFRTFAISEIGCWGWERRAPSEEGDGIEQEGPVAIVSSFRGGLCTHVKDYGEWGQALEAVGLSE